MKRTLIITALSCIALASMTFAADVKWTNAVAGTFAWEHAGNWTNRLGQAAVPALSTDHAKIRIDGLNSTIVYSQTTNPIYALNLENFSGSMLTLNITNAMLQTVATNTGGGGDGLYMNNYVRLNIDNGGTYLHNGIAFWNGTININNGGLYSNIVSAATYQWQAGNPKAVNVNSGGVWFANCGVNMGYDFADHGAININKGGLFSRATDGALNIANRRGVGRFNINSAQFNNVQVTDGDSDNAAINIAGANASGSNTYAIMNVTDSVVSNRGRLIIVNSSVANCSQTGIVNIAGGTWYQHGYVYQERYASAANSRDAAYLNIMSNAVVYQTRGGFGIGRYDGYGELNILSGGQLLSTVNGDGVCLGGNVNGAWAAPRPSGITVSGTGSLLRCDGWALRIGTMRGSNTLLVANGGTVVTTQRLKCSDNTAASNNWVIVSNAFLFATNSAATVTFTLTRLGGFELSGGTAVVDKIAANGNENNKVLLNKGLFVLKGDSLDLNTNPNRPLVVGNGVDPMTLRLDRPARVFFNSDIVVTNNGVLQMLNGVTNQSTNVRLRGGTVSPGASVGTVWFENALTFEDGATYLCEKDAGPNVMDKINCGALTINSGAKVTIVPLAGATSGGQSNVIIQATSVSGFANLQLDLSQTPTWSGELYQSGTSIGVILVPEPAVLGLALLGLLALRKR